MVSHPLSVTPRSTAGPAAAQSLGASSSGTVPHWSAGFSPPAPRKNFHLLASLLIPAILLLAPLAAQAQTKAVTVDPGTSAVVYPPTTQFLQTFPSASRTGTVPRSADQVGYETDTHLFYRATGTAAGNWTVITAGSSGSWGSITGTLSDQTDLNTALGGKVPTTRTVAGHALSSDVSIAFSDLTGSASLSQIAQSGATTGQVLAWSGTAWAPAAGGLTVGTTAIASGTNGNLLYNNSGTLGELSTVSTALGGLGTNAGSSSGVPLFASGSVSFLGTTGSSTFVRSSAPTISGGSITGLTTLSIKDGSYNLNIGPASGSLTATTSLAFDVGSANRTITLRGNLTTAGAFLTSGANSLTLTTTGATNVTLPTTGTLVGSSDTGTVTNTMLANSAITIAGSSTSLGGTISQDTITGLSTTGIIKRAAANTLGIAASGTDYEVPITFSTGLTRSTNTVTVNSSQSISTLSNLTSNGYVTTSGGTGALSISTSSDVLDGIGSTRGSILYRGASGWAALTPGTSGYVLQSAGAGADPSWAAASGGGHTIQEEGSNLTARTYLNFVGGGVTASDDSGNSATKVTVSRTGVYRTISAKASELIPRVTNGPGINSTESSTNKVNWDSLDYDPSTAQYAHLWVRMPEEWDAGTVKAKLTWTADSGSGDVVWKVSGAALGDNQAVDVAQGTAQSVTNTLQSSNVCVTAATSAITIGNTPAAGKWVVFEVSRDAANGSDTLGTNARLIGVTIQYLESSTESSSW